MVNRRFPGRGLAASAHQGKAAGVSFLEGQVSWPSYAARFI